MWLQTRETETGIVPQTPKQIAHLVEACDIVTVTDQTVLRSLFQTCDTQDDEADKPEHV